ncbi:hypothetical protein KIN20_006395 [Parelaphostrongylus tenuis]|uniref:Uncharacterized protein n=1 Tax=Parelaphostrongylus tenuis TaxID=148309 RepID=A0AAD5QIA1_PARTN|nr:hypothetical protein KIN20_006395 [Parelaphostrongylus tenuis]
MLNVKTLRLTTAVKLVHHMIQNAQTYSIKEPSAGQGFKDIMTTFPKMWCSVCLMQGHPPGSQQNE